MARADQLGPRIFLHLGTHKTGSTAIQRNFVRHRDVLAAHGLSFVGPGAPFPDLFSAFHPDPMRRERRHHRNVTQAELDARHAEALARLDNQLSRVTTDCAMVSDEYLAMLPPPRLRALKDHVAQFGRVEAVYVYRDLPGWLASNTQELAKAGKATEPSNVARAVQRISDFPLKIARIFGPDACHFLKFEEIAEGGVCEGLLGALGLPGFAAMGLEETRERVAISGPAVEALFAYNRKHPLGDPERADAALDELKALPGPPYRHPGFTADEIALYGDALHRVAPLGLRLAPAESLPRRY